MGRDRLVLRAIAVAIGAIAWQQALSNPTGPSPLRGVTGISGLGSGAVTVNTNDARAIINWRSFSIGAGESTTFNQPSAAAAVLNRVTSHAGSSIAGSLQSNGRVFLINPNGVLFGDGSRVDTAGLVASSLGMSDSDFLSDRMRFARNRGAAVVNNGSITTSGAGAPVYLIGGSVTNRGTITSPQGEVVLGAGRSVEVLNPGTPDVTVQINAGNGRAVNLGQIGASSGRIDIFAASIDQGGTVEANTAVAGPNGKIVLKADRDIALRDDSSTTAIGASGRGGLLDLEARDILISGNASSGEQTARASRDITIKGVNGHAAVLAATGGSSVVSQDVQAGRSLTIDARNGNASLSQRSFDRVQSVSARGITLRGGACGAGCTRIARIETDSISDQDITIRNGGRLLLRDGGIISGAFGQITFTSGGRLDLLGGSSPGGVADIFHDSGQQIRGSPDITLRAGSAFARLDGEAQGIHARNLTLIGGNTAGAQALVAALLSQGITVDRDLALRADGGSALISSSEDTRVTVGRNVSLTGGRLPQAQAGIVAGGSSIDLTVGGLLRMREGSATDAWARVQVRVPVQASIELHFPNRSSGGWFVNGVPGAVTNGNSGFFVGSSPAVLGNTLTVTYGP